MIVFNRPFDETQNDFKRMWDFLIEDIAVKEEKFIWQLGRLGDWRYGIWSERKYFPNFMRKNVQLWFNSPGELIGLVISENCDNGFAVFTKRGYEFLSRELVDWVIKHWGSRKGQLTTEVNEYQVEYMRTLEEMGFQQDGQACVTRQFDLNKLDYEEPVLPEGLKIIDMGTNPDWAAKKILHNNGFNNKNTLTTFDLLQYESARENPVYNPFYDLSVVDSSGTHLSTCTAFVDYANNTAEVEKICTHREHWRRGLAEAVIRECLRRLKNDGIAHAYITGYSQSAINLYGKLGALKESKWFSYTLK